MGGNRVRRNDIGGLLGSIGKIPLPLESNGIHYPKMKPRKSENIELIHNKYSGILGEDTWQAYETCLSAVAGLLLEDKIPLGIVLIGPSGGTKTTVLNMFRDLPDDMTYYTDEFTPASFLTQAMNVGKDKLEEVDLIRKLPNKVFIVPDLAPLFGKKKDEFKHNMSTLTRVMDGQGFSRDGGVHGHREFRGECIFTMLGATVTLRPSVWSVISSMGTRLLFYRMPPIKDDQSMKQALISQLSNSSTFEGDIQDIKKATENFMESLITERGGLRNLKWNDKTTETQENIQLIVSVSQMVTKLRAKVETNDKGEYLSHKFFEVPHRVVNQLYKLSRGRAIIYGRKRLDKSDVMLALKVGLSSVKEVRGRIVESLFNEYPNSLSKEDLMASTDLKPTKLTNELRILEEIGIATKSTSGRAGTWELNEEWGNQS